MTSSDNAPSQLRLTRTLNAPRTTVYRMLSDPVELAKWWGPHGFTSPSLDFDPEVGRAYRIAMQPPDGDMFHLIGEFQEVQPPTRLSYTFCWDPPDPDDQETVVTLTLEERGNATILHLTQGEFATVARRALHDGGWTDGFERLEQVLSES